MQIEGDRILAAHLAASVPAFAALPGDTALAYAPVPGARRIFRPGELQRVAKRYGLALDDPAEMCVEYRMQSLTRERLVSAMQAQPGVTGARIEVVDFSRAPAPSGKLEFPVAALSIAESDAPALWKGYVGYGVNRRFPVWARVKVRRNVQRVIAVEKLPTGRPIEAGQVRVESRDAPLERGEFAETVEQVAGRIPRRSIPAGASIRPEALEEAAAVGRGEMVNIEVQSGRARLGFVGRAETAGRKGEVIAVRNPETGKRFTARVQDKGRAVVTAGSASSRSME